MNAHERIVRDQLIFYCAISALGGSLFTLIFLAIVKRL